MAISLTATDHVLNGKLAAAKNSVEPDWVVSYGYINSSGNWNWTVTAGGIIDENETTLVSAPAASEKYIINEIHVTNQDDAAVTLNIYFSDGADDYVFIDVVLGVGYSMHYTGDGDVRVYDASGVLQVAT